MIAPESIEVPKKVIDSRVLGNDIDEVHEKLFSLVEPPELHVLGRE